MKISPSLLMCTPQRSIQHALHWPPPQLLPRIRDRYNAGGAGRSPQLSASIIEIRPSGGLCFILFSIFIFHLRISWHCFFVSPLSDKHIYLPGFQNELDLIADNPPLISATPFHAASLELVSEMFYFFVFFLVISWFGRRLKADWAKVHQPNSTSHQRFFSATAAPPRWAGLPLRCQWRLSLLNLSSGRLKLV